jgi:hypothetical protein
MKAFSLDHLTEVEFEEFCFDLLGALGAMKLSWRKGTGGQSSPADQGRDIECVFRHKDIDEQRDERWFVDSKHYKQGVPPGKLQGLLSWAAAERPDVVLIIASNFLSNGAKNFLESYTRNNKPSFKIKVWERPDLERLVLGKPLVMRKYGLGGEFEFLNILHPAHVTYLRNPPLNTLDYFFKVLDGLEHSERSSFLFGTFLHIINPEFVEPTDSKRQTLGDLAKTKVNYADFRKKVYALAGQVSPIFLIRSIVFEELSSLFMSGDKTNVEEVRKNMRESVSWFEEKLKKPHPDPETIRACIRDLSRSIENAEERTNEGYERYCSFCEKVVVPLLEEVLPIPPHVKQLIEEETAYAEAHRDELHKP